MHTYIVVLKPLWAYRNFNIVKYACKSANYDLYTYGRAKPLYVNIIPNANFIALEEWKMPYQGFVEWEFSKMDFKYKNCMGEVVTIFKLKYEKYMYLSGRVSLIVILKGQYDFFFPL